MIRLIIISLCYLSYGFLTLLFCQNIFAAKNKNVGKCMMLGIVMFWPMVVLQLIFLLWGKE